MFVMMSMVELMKRNQDTSLINTFSMFNLLPLLDVITALYFVGFIFVGPLVFTYFFQKGYKFYGYFVALLGFCYLCRMILPIIIFSIIGESSLGSFFLLFFSFFTSLSVLLVFPLAVMIVNFLLQGKILESFIVVLFLPVIYVSSLESHFLFYPLIDTTHSSEFTLKRFKSITPGMTRQQVEVLIGKPHPSAGGYLGDETGCESQTGDNGPLAKSLHLDFAWLDSVVCYDNNDRVVKTQMNYVSD